MSTHHPASDGARACIRWLRPLCLAGIAFSSALGGALSQAPAFAHAQGASWSLAQDFSATANPNGAWSYGWSASRGSTFSPLPTSTNEYSISGFNCWTGAPTGSFVPDICHNSTNATINPDRTNPVPPGGILFHPGPQGQNADVRWTAPSCGTYNVNATFTGLDDVGPTTTDVAVLRDSALLFAGNVDGYGAQQVFAQAVPAATGETIDFTVGFGTDDTYYYDSTGLDVKISVSSACDSTPPTTAVALTPAPNASGWNNGNVGITLNATDEQGGSGVKQIVYSATGAQALVSTTVPGSSAALTVSAEGATTLSYSATDSAGNVEPPKSVTVRLDKTPPAISATVSPAPNAYGWNNTNVSVGFTCSDALSGMASCTGPTTVSIEGASQAVNGAATDNAGNTAGATASVSIDRTPPIVTYTGNAGSYTVDQTVKITCSAADPSASNGATGSGIATTTCQNISGPAYGFTIGTNSYSATATDKAGNSGHGSTSFTVLVNAGGLDGLIGQLVTNPGVASSLQSQIGSIASAPNANAKAGKFNAFTNLVNAQTGKALNATQAALLTRLAGYL